MKKKSEMTYQKLQLLEANTMSKYKEIGFINEDVKLLLDAVEQLRDIHGRQLHEESGVIAPYELSCDRIVYKSNNDISIMKEKLRILRAKISHERKDTIDWLLLKSKIDEMQSKLDARLAMNNPVPLLKFGQIEYTYHALLRYVERKYSIDINKIKKQIKEQLSFMELELELDEIKDVLVIEYLSKYKGFDMAKVKNSLKMELDAQFYYTRDYVGKLEGTKYTYLFKGNKLITLYKNNSNDNERNSNSN